MTVVGLAAGGPPAVMDEQIDGDQEVHLAMVGTV